MKKASTTNVLRLSRILETEYGKISWYRRRNAIDELVYTILSQHTSDINSERAFENLMTRFDSIEAISNADVIQIDRGGQVTYHGPGQLVCYPILDLHDYKMSVSWYMRFLEDIVINSMKLNGIKGQRKEGLTGVWVEDEKICAMGVRLARWVSMHGFALNINPDMNYYNGMIPCGIQEYGITSMNDVLNKNVDLYNVMEDFSINFLNLFERCNEEI